MQPKVIFLTLCAGLCASPTAFADLSGGKRQSIKRAKRGPQPFKVRGMKGFKARVALGFTADKVRMRIKQGRLSNAAHGVREMQSFLLGGHMDNVGARRLVSASRRAVIGAARRQGVAAIRTGNAVAMKESVDALRQLDRELSPGAKLGFSAERANLSLNRLRRGALANLGAGLEGAGRHKALQVANRVQVDRKTKRTVRSETQFRGQLVDQIGKAQTVAELGSSLGLLRSLEGEISSRERNGIDSRFALLVGQKYLAGLPQKAQLGETTHAAALMLSEARNYGLLDANMVWRLLGQVQTKLPRMQGNGWYQLPVDKALHADLVRIGETDGNAFGKFLPVER